MFRIQRNATLIGVKKLEVNRSAVTTDVTVYDAGVNPNAPYWLQPFVVPDEVDKDVCDALVMHKSDLGSMIYLPNFMRELLKSEFGNP